MELLHMHLAHERHFDHIQLSACWMLLSQMVKTRPAKQYWVQGNAKVLEPVVNHTVHAAVAGEIGARQLANVAYGAALTFATLGQPGAALFTALAWEAQCRVGNFNP